MEEYKTNEEKAKMIAEQCKPCSEDFYSGIYQGVLLALNAESKALENSTKWEELQKKVDDACEKNGGGQIRPIDIPLLVEIGEFAAAKTGWLNY